MKQTPSQTVGPYFAYGLTPEQYLYDFRSLVDNKMVSFIDHPNAVLIEGQVFDGQGNVIPDAMLEIWLKDSEKELFGRFGTGTEAGNKYVFHTLKPKPFAGEAPFLTVILFMRGQLIHSYTRIYFEDEQALNANDEVLNSIPEGRRNTLMAQKTKHGYRFDIHMQGDQETVFFDI